MSGRAETPHLLISSQPAADTTMSGSIRPADLRWLVKILRKIEHNAQPAGATDRVSIRLTTTELKRAIRLGHQLGWHVQHVELGRRVADPIPGVPRGTSPT